MDQGEPYSGRPRRGVLAPLILMLIVFVAGVALAALAVHRWDRLAEWLSPTKAAPVALQQLPTAPLPVIVQTPAPQPQQTDPALTAKVEQIDERIDTIAARADAASGDADRAEGLLVAFAARRALDRGQPLGYVEGLLRKHFGGSDAQAVAMVIGAAQRPVTLLQLQNSLVELSPKLQAVGPNESWWTGVKREVGNLFVVRKAATPSTEPSEQQDRAARALTQGQVDVALAEVARMPGAGAAAAWIGDARRYVLAHNALDRIEASALLKPPAAQPAIPTI